MFADINNTNIQKIYLPSGHYLDFQLVQIDLSDLVEMNILDTDIAQLSFLADKGKAIQLKKPKDSINLEGSTIEFC